MKNKRLYLVIAVALIVAVLAVGLATLVSIRQPALPLSAYAAAPASVTISGISSGGFFAVQAHIANSSLFKAAAVFGAGPYNCSEGSAQQFMARCANSDGTLEIPTQKLIDLTRRWAAEKQIDPIENLKTARIYLFTGKNDKVVTPAVTGELYKFYSAFVPRSQITLVEHPAAGHAWVSPYAANRCEVTDGLLLNNCGIDPEQDIFTLFYGALRPKTTGKLTGRLIAFDQLEFIEERDGLSHSIDPKGWIYVPASCDAADGCKLHVALHGCMQDYSMIGDAFVRQSGLNEWADSNGILVVYPQIVLSRKVGNPYGCWDVWGYDGPDHLWKSGKQIKLLTRIVDRIISVRKPTRALQPAQAGTSPAAEGSGK